MDSNILGMIAAGALGVFILAFGTIQVLRQRKRAGFRAAKGKGCPNCQCLHYRFAPEEDAIVVARRRICSECGQLYEGSLPRWVGIVAYFAALAVVAAMMIDMVSPPRDWDMHLTWKGRLTALAIAGMLGWMGTRVIQGKSQI